jgi:hypothetical protein
MEGLENDCERARDFLARELARVDSQGDWQYRIRWRTDLKRTFTSRYGLARVTTRLMICELALHAYYLDQAAWPEQLDDLVPRYLSRVPEDPFTHQPITYYRTNQGYRLYWLPPGAPKGELGWTEQYDFSFDGGWH